MIKTAGELITQAQKQIDCVNPVEAKSLFDSSDDAVIIAVCDLALAEVAESEMQ